MKPAPFKHHAPTSLAQTISLLNELGESSEVSLVSGGQSLIPMMALRLAQPEHLVDLNGVAAELSGIRRVDGTIQIGAMTRQRAAERSPDVGLFCPLLAEALPMWGHIQIRNRGTLGGSLAHADPAAEFPSIALALNATVHVAGRHGERTIRAADFFTGFLSTSIEPGEVLTSVDLDVLPDGSGASFQEVSRRHGDFAMVGVAAAVTVDAGTVTDARLVFSGVSDTPYRATAAEQMLIGTPGDAESIEAAAVLSIADLTPPADIHASTAYRKHVSGVLARRALGTALQRARS